MKPWLLSVVTVALVAVALAPAEAAHCAAKGSRKCLDGPAAVNLSSVPDISKQIVSEEPTAAQPVSHTLDAPPITTYTGPIVGVNSMVHAPTVGYYWSLDPDTDTH
ncbi:MAG TPA: hypothetical protein VMF05_02275 [Stellaceae bacterium]|nr:hypothetical protein [Stellaceae bacterium]